MSLTNQDDDDAIIGVAATSVLAVGVAIIGAYEHESSIPKEPYVNNDQEREFYMNSILNGSDVHCVGQIKMSKHALYELCNALRRNSFLCLTKNMSIESIHRCFHIVLQAILKLYPILIKSPDGTIQLDITNKYRPHGFQIQQDKYYLVDAGYGLRKGFIPPYHGIRYHLQEYSDCPPQNEKNCSIFIMHH
ncbi:hypothetical protein P3S68_022688 [Capsicum galapagoense]